MKLSKLMLAVATLAAGASVIAAPDGNRIAISSGASATLGNLMTNTSPVSAMRSLCTAAGGVATLFGAGNFRTMVCANSVVVAGNGAGQYGQRANADFINFDGTTFAELRLNVDPGSFGAVLVLNPNTLSWHDPATSTNTATLPANSVKVGGLLDLGIDGFTSGTIGTNNVFTATKVGIAQTFGLAVSGALYTALFNAQKVPPVTVPATVPVIPAACLLTDTNIPACVPTVGKAQMATIMADNQANAAYTKGLGFLTGFAADNNTQLRYVRRVDTSGTQAAAQNYFLGLPCSTSALSVVPEPTLAPVLPEVLKNRVIGKIRVMAAPATGDVRTELNKAGVFAIGVMSGENNQTGSWKWVRVNGANMGENATPGSAGITNTYTQRNGNYDFYYESVYQGGSDDADAFWATVSLALNSIAAPIGLVENTILSAGYTKGGQACINSASE